MDSAAQQNHDPFMALLCREFLADAADRLDLMYQALEPGTGPGGDPLLAIRRGAHNLKGMGGSFGFSAVSLIARRLEDYILDLRALEPRHVGDIELFLGPLKAIVESGRDLEDDAAVALLRRLPAHPGAESAAPKGRDLEILLVSPTRAVSQIAAHALRGLGHRVTIATSAWGAIELAVRGRPDLLVTSAVMAGVGGIELLRALAAMTATKDLPGAVLTSFSKQHHELRSLPPEVPVIRLGDDFDADLADALTGLGLA